MRTVALSAGTRTLFKKHDEDDLVEVEGITYRRDRRLV